MTQPSAPAETASPDVPPDAAAQGTKAPGQESLAPQHTRIMGRPSYFLAWFGGCVSIGTFAMGSSVVGTLNLVQATLAIAIGCFVIGIALAVNGAPGYKYGIPFMVQARSAFGFAGTRIPGLVRAVPAVVWYGFQSWIGAGALNMVSATLFGFDNLISETLDLGQQRLQRIRRRRGFPIGIVVGDIYCFQARRERLG